MLGLFTPSTNQSALSGFPLFTPDGQSRALIPCVTTPPSRLPGRLSGVEGMGEWGEHGRRRAPWSLCVTHCARTRNDSGHCDRQDMTCVRGKRCVCSRKKGRETEREGRQSSKGFIFLPWSKNPRQDTPWGLHESDGCDVGSCCLRRSLLLLLFFFGFFWGRSSYVFRGVRSFLPPTFKSAVCVLALHAQR